jgi:hypothetical protein
MLTRKTTYGIRALLGLARSPRESLSVAELAAQERIPEHILSAILSDLRQRGIVRGERGPEVLFQHDGKALRRNRSGHLGKQLCRGSLMYVVGRTGGRKRGQCCPVEVGTRRKEALEAYPLDSLDMVGTIGAGGGLLGLVMAPDKVTYRVRPGNYLGQNDGKIVAIYDDRIEIVELVPDGAGGWLERQAKIALEDN